MSFLSFTDKPSGHPDGPRTKRPSDESGAFGKHSTLRRKTASRTRTSTPVKKENPVVEGFVSAYKYDLAIAAQQETNASTRTQIDSNPASHHVSTHNKEPTMIMVYGYSPNTLWRVIDLYEKVSHGIICEDYARQPPVELRRYPNSFSSPSIHRRPLTKQEESMAFKYFGGESWVKLTCESAEAADRAIEHSPMKIYGHLVYAELYHGKGPEVDQPIPVREEDGEERSFSGFRAPRKSSQPLSAASSHRATLQQRSVVTLPGSFDVTTQSQSDEPTSNDATSSATFTGSDSLDLHKRHVSQIEEYVFPTTTNDISTGPVGDYSPAMMIHFPEHPRTIIHPPAEAFLPQPTWLERQITWLRSSGLIPGDFIGDWLPILDNGDFDWARASWYWRACYWLDSHLGTDICGLKEECE